MKYLIIVDCHGGDFIFYTVEEDVWNKIQSYESENFNPAEFSDFVSSFLKEDQILYTIQKFAPEKAILPQVNGTLMVQVF